MRTQPQQYSLEDIAEHRKLRRSGVRFALMTILFFASGILVWALFLAYIKSKEKAMEPYGMPFAEWVPRYRTALLIGLTLVVIYVLWRVAAGS